jgi:hypothetical protein
MLDYDFEKDKKYEGIILNPKENYSFTIAPVDTDSLAFCKTDMSPFSIEERDKYLKEINSFLPELIEMSDDGYYQTICILKAKNYILDDGKKIKIKGSGITDAKRELALREMCDKIVDALLQNKISDIATIYDSYIIEANNVQDISRWVTKRTISKAVLTPERTNEQKLFDALAGTEFKEGDKVYVYFDQNDALQLRDNWTGDENKVRLTKRVWDVLNIFSNVIDITQYPKYHLKGKQKDLQTLLGVI